MAENYQIAAVIKALKTLKLFNSQEKEMTLTELSTKAGITKSSMLRILASLEAEGFVRYNEDTKKYCLGITVFNLANTAFEFLDIKKIASPLLRKAAVETQLLIHLAIVEDGKVVVIDKIWPTDHFDMMALMSYIGGTVPVHCTGVGKVLAAFSSDKIREKLIKNCDFQRYTERTIGDPETFRAALQTVRNNGYGFNDGEHEPYLRCITRPIFDVEGKVLAAVSLSGLKDVITDEKFDYYNAMSQKVCSELSREFGYRGLQK